MDIPDVKPTSEISWRLQYVILGGGMFGWLSCLCPTDEIYEITMLGGAICLGGHPWCRTYR